MKNNKKIIIILLVSIAIIIWWLYSRYLNSKNSETTPKDVLQPSPDKENELKEATEQFNKDREEIKSDETLSPEEKTEQLAIIAEKEKLREQYHHLTGVYPDISLSIDALEELVFNAQEFSDALENYVEVTGNSDLSGITTITDVNILMAKYLAEKSQTEKDIVEEYRIQIMEQRAIALDLIEQFNAVSYSIKKITGENFPLSRSTGEISELVNNSLSTDMPGYGSQQMDSKLTTAVKTATLDDLKELLDDWVYWVDLYSQKVEWAIIILAEESEGKLSDITAQYNDYAYKMLEQSGNTINRLQENFPTWQDAQYALDKIIVDYNALIRENERLAKEALEAKKEKWVKRKMELGVITENFISTFLNHGWFLKVKAWDENALKEMINCTFSELVYCNYYFSKRSVKNNVSFSSPKFKIASIFEATDTGISHQRKNASLANILHNKIAGIKDLSINNLNEYGEIV